MRPLCGDDDGAIPKALVTRLRGQPNAAGRTLVAPSRYQPCQKTHGMRRIQNVALGARLSGRSEGTEGYATTLRPRDSQLNHITHACRK